MSQPLVEYLVENEPAFRKARLPALYSDFQTQRTLNPDGYQANVSAWRKALSHIVGSGLAPASRAAASSLFVLHSDEQLLRALESKQYGRPLALGAVVRESVAAKDLIPLREFLDAKESIYNRPWSVWNLASWTMKQLGVADMLKKDTLPPGEFVVVANVEQASKAFQSQTAAAAAHQTRFERTFSKSHFYRTFNANLVPAKHLSETDMDVLLRFLSRDKHALLYDGTTVKIPSGTAENELTPADASIAQLKELLASLTHQTSLLSSRIEALTAQAATAVSKSNRVAALAALRARKLATATLAARFESVHQLEQVAGQIEQAADNVLMAQVMEASAAALEGLNAKLGGVERVEEVVGRLRGQMEAVDEVGRILAEEGGTVVVDEGEIDGELEAMEAEEGRKAREEEERRREEEEKRREEEVRKRLEAAGEAPQGVAAAEGESELRSAEDLMSRMSLTEEAERQAS